MWEGKENDGESWVYDREIFHTIMEFLGLFHISVDFAFKRDTCYLIKSKSCQPQLNVAFRQRKNQLFGKQSYQGLKTANNTCKWTFYNTVNVELDAHEWVIFPYYSNLTMFRED